jgi:phosphate/sulfate permease
MTLVETGGAIALFGATWLGIPVSTTHTITGSIVGVGAARRPSAVRWGIARSIVVAWGITLPASAAVAATATGSFEPLYVGYDWGAAVDAGGTGRHESSKAHP